VRRLWDLVAVSRLRALPPLAAAALVAAAGLPGARAQRRPIFRTERGGPRLTVAARARTGVQPKSVTVSPDGRRVVVCNFGRPDRDNVFVYDAETLSRVGAVSFEGNAVESAFSPDGRTLYVSNFRRHVVEVIDFATLEVRGEVEVGSHPKTIVVTEDGSTLFVADYFDRSISVVGAAELREVRRLRTAERPRGMGLLHDGTLLAAAFQGDVIHRFAPGADEQAGQWDSCRYPRDILPAPDGRTFYLTCSLGSIRFFRPEDGGRPFGIATTGRNPRSIGLSGDGRWLGVANFSSSDVTLIDTVERTHMRHRVPGASRVVGLAMHPGPGIRMYATSWDTAEVIMLTGAVDGEG